MEPAPPDYQALPKRPLLKSAMAWWISAALVITKGPWPTTGSFSGAPVMTSSIASASACSRA